MYERESSARGQFDAGKIVRVSVVAILLVFSMFSLGKLFEKVDADEIMVVQDAFDGDLHWYTSPGVKPQWFGKVTKYPKRSIYEFETQVRFNDGGHGTMKGSIQYEMPLDDAHLTGLHTRFGSAEAIQRQLMEKVTTKSVYMTGPLMSSRESYAEKRNYLINFVEDQIAHGVYRTVQREIRVLDPLTGQEKSAVAVEIVMAAGRPVRQEEAVLAEFGIKPFNFAINALDYDKRVEEQINEQQKIAMAVQTSIAEARKAEQRKLTVEQQGAADAAKAKWDQEVIKARQVTAAEQRLAVATLDRQSAEQTKQQQILLGQGEAERRRLVLAADGALAQKLSTMERIQAKWAEAYAKRAVPAMVMGSNGANGTDQETSDFSQMLTLLTAKQLGVDLTVPRGPSSGGN